MYVHKLNNQDSLLLGVKVTKIWNFSINKTLRFTLVQIPIYFYLLLKEMLLLK